MFLLLTIFKKFCMFSIAMENTEQNTQPKVQIAARVDANIFAAIDGFRIEEDRNISGMIERLLKTHPRVQEILAQQTEAAGAGA